MDGLEAVEIKLSYIISESLFVRVDSDFYNKTAISFSNEIREKRHLPFGKIIKELTDYTANGSFASLAENVSISEDFGYAKWIRIQNLDSNNFVENIKFVDEKSYNFLEKSKLSKNDLLISKTGEYFGKAFIFRNDEDSFCTLADNIFLIRLNDEKLQSIIFAYFRSKFGKAFVLRWGQGAGQPTIIKDSIRKIDVPIFSSNFINIINNKIDIHFNHIQQSKQIYCNAKKLLLLNLGLENFVPTEKAIAIKTFKDSFVASSRIDSEYYQAKYDELFAKLKLLPCKALGGENGIVSIKKSIEPGSEYYCDEGIDFVRVSDVSKQGITMPEIKIPNNTVENIFQLFPKKDTILLSKDGSVGIAYKVEEDLKCVTSGAILHLTVKNKKEILPDYLTLVLNSKIVQMQAERDAGGSIIQHWKPSEIEQVIIPLLPMEKQQEIANLVQDSFALKKKFKQLLEDSIKAVEMAIETDEETAIKWLEEHSINNE